MSGPVVAVFGFFCCLLTLTNGQYTERTTITFPGYWKKILDYDNHRATAVNITKSTTVGFAEKHTETKKLTATTKLSGEVTIGASFMIANVSVKFSVSHEMTTETVTMNEKDVYESRTLIIVSKVEAYTRLYRWQLAMSVNGEEILFEEFYDAENTDETRPIGDAAATLWLRQKIVPGETKFRLQHKTREEFITIVSRKLWPCATLSENSGFYFQLGDVGNSRYRIITLNSTSAGYNAMYTSEYGGVYFDTQWDNEKQYWTISQEPPFYIGDVVTFRNVYWPDASLRYYNGPATSVYCQTGTVEKWVFV